LNNAEDTKHEHAVGEEGYAAGEGGRVTEMRAGEGRTAGRRRERERRFGRENEKKLPLPTQF